MEYHKWMAKLLGYSFENQYKPEKTHLVVDALSRHPRVSEQHSHNIVMIKDWSIIA